MGEGITKDASPQIQIHKKRQIPQKRKPSHKYIVNTMVIKQLNLS